MNTGSDTNKKIRNSVIPAIFVGIVVAFTIFILGLLHIFVIPVAKFIVFSAFASSSFLIFMEPKNPSSMLSKFVKSYIIAGLIGISGFYISAYIGIYYTLAIIETVIALMLVAFKAEHPPSMGIGAVFILEKANLYALIFLFTGVAIIICSDLFLYKFVYVVEKDVKKIEKKS